MGVIDKELMRKHVVEERKLRFEEFVKAQNADHKSGMKDACLYSVGYRDSYGPVVFSGGRHNNHWVLPADKNPKALLYTKRSDAESYAKELQKILRANGYPFSKVWVEQVAVRSSTARPYSKLFRPDYSFEPEDRFLIRMKVH